MTDLRQQKIFYGWWIVLGAFSGVQVGSIAIHFTFGVFLKPMAESFLSSRGEIAFAVSIKSIGAMMSAPLIGLFIDRYGVRPVIAVSGLLSALGLASIRFLPAEIGYLYLFFFLLGFADSGTAFLAYGTLVSQWFERRRGIALGVAMSGVGVGGFWLPPLFSLLITRLGWVNAYAVLGSFSLILIPISLLLFKERPQEIGFLPDGERPAEGRLRTEQKVLTGMTWKEARRSSSFWFLAGGFFLVSTSINGVLIHLVPILTDGGMEASRASLYISLLAGASLVGRILSGYLADRWIGKYVAAIFFTGAAAGIFVLWSGPEEGLLAVGIFAVGLALGAEIDLSGYLVAKCFGLVAYGQIYSYIFGIFLLGVVVGPAFVGFLFDVTAAYHGALLTFVVAMALAALLMLPLR